ncbi:hypothetical protein D1872_306320 [compost metagenome]
MADFKFAVALYIDEKEYVLIADKTYAELKVNGEIVRGKVTNIDSFEMGDFAVGNNRVDPDDVEEVIQVATIYYAEEE